MRLVLIQLFVFFMSAAHAESACNYLSEDLDKILQTEPQWRILDIQDLNEDDQQLWRQHHKDQCPGMVAVNLTGNGSIYYALALIQHEAENRLNEKLIVATTHKNKVSKHTLSPSSNIAFTNAASPFVVRKVLPGRFHDLKTDREISIRHEAIIYEKIEATATLFFYKKNRLRSALLFE